MKISATMIVKFRHGQDDGDKICDGSGDDSIVDTRSSRIGCREIDAKGGMKQFKDNYNRLLSATVLVIVLLFQTVTATSSPTSLLTTSTSSKVAKRSSRHVQVPSLEKDVTFHVLALPHTVVSREFSPCAYTMKVLRLCRMLHDLGLVDNTILYANEGSSMNKGCKKLETIFTTSDRLQYYGNDTEWKSKKKFFNFDNPTAKQMYTSKVVAAIQRNVKERDDDKKHIHMLLVPFGYMHYDIVQQTHLPVIETGIGYNGSYAPYRVYESQTWMSALTFDQNVNHYYTVIPNCYYPEEFEVDENNDDDDKVDDEAVVDVNEDESTMENKDEIASPSRRPYFAYVGRLISAKGLYIVKEIMDHLPSQFQLHVAGQGNFDIFFPPNDTLTSDRVVYHGVVDPQQRNRIISNAIAVFAPTLYDEPFGGIMVETQFLGKPVITTDQAVMSETVWHGVTGYRCRTLRCFVSAASHTATFQYNSTLIKERAIQTYSCHQIKYQYYDYFRDVINLWNKDGWNLLLNTEDNHHLDIEEEEEEEEEEDDDDDGYDIVVDDIGHILEQKQFYPSVHYSDKIPNDKNKGATKIVISNSKEKNRIYLESDKELMMQTINTTAPALLNVVFHIVGVSYSIVDPYLFSACPFTMKVYRMCRMLHDLGFMNNTVLYANEGSDLHSHCSKFKPIFTTQERQDIYGNDNETWKSGKQFFGHDQANVKNEYTNRVLSSIDEEVKDQERRQQQQPKTDTPVTNLLLIPVSYMHDDIARESGLEYIETGIGYGTNISKYRVYHSYSWMSAMTEGAFHYNSYHAVIPNCFYSDEFGLDSSLDARNSSTVSTANPRRSNSSTVVSDDDMQQPYFVYIGRIISDKGINIVLEIMRHMKDHMLHVAGQGDLNWFLKKNDPLWSRIVYHKVLGLTERNALLSGADALLAPSVFKEPFGNVMVEAQFLGIPVISTDHAGMSETVWHGVSGFRCRTLRCFVAAAKGSIHLDRATIKEYAEQTFSCHQIKYQYLDYFRDVLNLWDGRGWGLITGETTHDEGYTLHQRKFYPPTTIEEGEIKRKILQDERLHRQQKREEKKMKTRGKHDIYENDGTAITTTIANLTTEVSHRNICLNMIVKDETAVLPRLFKSIKDYIDYYVIVDTGSTDDTIALIKNELTKMYNISGNVYEREWVNFGANRQHALELAIQDCPTTHVLFLDADDEVVVTDSEFYKQLHPDVNYNIQFQFRKNEKMSWRVPRLINIVRSRWKWEGPLHEYLTHVSGSDRIDTLKGMQVKWSEMEGSRSHNHSHESKFMKDAKLLEAALRSDPNDTRNQFYLGRSFFDAGYYEKAIGAYRKRIAMAVDYGGWDEEKYYSQLEIARSYVRLNESDDQVIYEFMKAFEIEPRRCNPLYELTEYLRLKGLYAMAYPYAIAGSTIPKPKNIDDHFIFDEDVYDWKMLDELGSVAFYVGNLLDGRKAYEEIFRRIQDDGLTIDEKQVQRMKENYDFYR